MATLGFWLMEMHREEMRSQLAIAEYSGKLKSLPIFPTHNDRTHVAGESGYGSKFPSHRRCQR